MSAGRIAAVAARTAGTARNSKPPIASMSRASAGRSQTKQVTAMQLFSGLLLPTYRT